MMLCTLFLTVYFANAYAMHEKATAHGKPQKERSFVRRTDLSAKISLLEEAKEDDDKDPKEELPKEVAEVEKDLEKVEEEVKKDIEAVVGTNNPVGKEITEAVGDVETLERKALKEGPVAEVAGIINEDLEQPEPCKSVASCLHVITISGIIFVVTIMSYFSKYFERRVTSTEGPTKKEEFQGDMAPVALSGLPGGCCSALCLASYFCCCCLRMETYGKLEKWDSSTKYQRILIFASVMFFGHVLAVFIAIALGLPPNYVHIAGVGSMLVFPLGLAYLGYLMADKRVQLMNMQKKGMERARYGAELAKSVACVPCVTGQEVEFMEKYKETFKEEAAW